MLLAAMEQGSSSLTSAALSQSSISIAGSVEPKNADSWLSYKNGSYYLTVEAQVTCVKNKIRF